MWKIWSYHMTLHHNTISSNAIWRSMLSFYGCLSVSAIVNRWANKTKSWHPTGNKGDKNKNFSPKVCLISYWTLVHPRNCLHNLILCDLTEWFVFQGSVLTNQNLCLHHFKWFAPSLVWFEAPEKKRTVMIINKGRDQRNRQGFDQRWKTLKSSNNSSG